MQQHLDWSVPCPTSIASLCVMQYALLGELAKAYSGLESFCGTELAISQVIADPIQAILE